jgi:sulfite exporter TauE/SafE/copper chaperone CopZ
MINQTQKYNFHVHGMHCKACIALIESELSDVDGISKVKASLDKNTVEVVGDFGDKEPILIATELTKIVESHGYTLSLEKKLKKVNWSDFKIAFPVAVGFIAFFIVLQKLGIVNAIGGGEMTLGTALLVGVIASLSTCMAVVGGLVLSVSANFAKEGDKVRPQIMFHISRLISCFVFGGVIGAIGSTVTLGGTGTLILSIMVALVMFILGINLLDVFPWAKKFQPTIPNFIGKRVHNIKTLNHTLTPVLLGALTFILPCGFTQSMQIYSLSLGSFWGGAITMFTFALGTLPVLALLSFGASGFHKKIRSDVFFKTAGLVVIFFALINILSALAGAGIIPPLFNL